MYSSSGNEHIYQQKTTMMNITPHLKWGEKLKTVCAYLEK